MAGPVALKVRTDARYLWPSWLALALVIGLAAGTVMAAAAGARRTDSAYPRLVEETNAADVAIILNCEPRLLGGCPSPADAAETARGWPGVRDAAPAALTSYPVTTSDGEDLLDCEGRSGELSVMVPLDERAGRDLMDLRLVDGRRPDPSLVDEVVLAPAIAAEQGIEVGDRLTVYPKRDFDCERRSTWGDPVDVTVVGLGFTAIEVQPKLGGYYYQALHTTPAFDQEVATVEINLLLDLAPGVTFSDVEAQAEVPSHYRQFDLETQFSEPIAEGVDADVSALRLLAVLAAVASACVVLPAVGRLRRALGAEDAHLGAIGWARRERVLRSTFHTAVIWVAGMAVALVVVLVASTRSPIGDAHAIEPAGDPQVDLFVVAVGGLALAVLLGAALVVPTIWSRVRSERLRRTPVASRAADLGLTPAVVLGLRIGIEPDRREVAARSSLVSLAVGLSAVIGVLVYTASAQHLRETPAARGVVWDDVVFIGDGEDAGEVASDVRRVAGVETAIAGLLFAYPVDLGPERPSTSVAAFEPGPDGIEVPVATGRAPQEDDELLLNPVLAKRLDVDLGERLDIAITRGAVSPYERASLDDVGVHSYEVVGTGPVPVAYGQFASGVALTVEGYRSLLPSLLVDFELEGLDFVLVARDGGAKAPVLDRLADAGVEVTAADIDPDRYFGEALVVDETGTESVPDLLALLMLLSSAGLLAYGVSFTLVHSRGELAVVQAIGFDRRMLRRTARWVGLSQAAVVLAIAVPVGVVVGRGAWRRYAEGLGVAPVDQIPWVEVSALALLTLVASVGLSALIMATVLRRGPAATLHADE